MARTEEIENGVPKRDPRALPTFGQRLWRRFCLLAARVFYSRFEVAGKENIPASGPVVLTANHVNALVDPLIVQAGCARPIHPLARSGLFRNPFLRPVLAVLQAVPIYRRNPRQADSTRNEDSFRRCYEYLRMGRVLLIFPEGQSHSDPQLRPLKTGAARLALGSEEAGGRRPTIVPVGLTFTHKGRFRSKVLVQFGPPVPFETRPGEEGEDAVRRYTAAIEDGLRRVTLNVDSWEDLALLRLLHNFFALRRGRRRRRRTLAGRFRALQKLIDAHRQLRHARPELVARLAGRLRRFERLCRRYGVQDYQLNLRYRPMLVLRFVLRSLAFALFVFPLALWGLLNSALPYLATRRVSLLLARGRDQYDTTSMLFGLLFFSLFWGAQSFIVFYLWGLWPAVAYALSLPLTVAVAFKVARERLRIQENVRVFFLFLRKQRVRGYLRQKRRELEVELARVARVARRAMHRGPELD